MKTLNAFDDVDFDPLQFFGVTASSTVEEVRKAIKQKLLIHHTDERRNVNCEEATKMVILYYSQQN
jgi:preprotein translocase subunit Sec63